MPAFVIHVVDDLRRGRETWPVRFLLSALSLAVTLFFQMLLAR